MAALAAGPYVALRDARQISVLQFAQFKIRRDSTISHHQGVMTSHIFKTNWLSKFSNSLRPKRYLLSK
jgi:hypothetical protein